MFDSKKIKEIREELGYSQVEFYDGIMSKVSYQKFEKNKKDVSIQQLQTIAQKLTMRPEEILYRTDVTRLKSLPFWKQKLDLPSFLSSKEIFFEKLKELENNKTKGFGYYNLYAAMLAMGVQKNFINSDYFSKKDIKALQTMYKKRRIFYSFDYEIVSNLVFLVNPEEINFLLENLFPVTESNGTVFDFCVQECITNLISKYQHLENYSSALIYINIFKSLRKIPDFNIDLSMNLEIVYLEQLTRFLETRDIAIFLKAVQTVEMFEQMGYVDTYNNLSNELKSISERENFVYPNESTYAIQPFSVNTEL
ncbi:helix-turn-helix transcriptional regulator [Enterococcus faecalis]|uniref:helix-turn-helix domain-containing protein n=1 Tax=Enterococcus faecalis TaxID=1351 RepID=UPI0019FF167F|nr:helix-turn-helix transcriptional regulator [Enterococcus faecalis]EIB6821708.1 helix-turn-helix transcriptional regulator [Enterococcus faecalis]EKZ0058040.1 helix-turn-helix transcriptional regulator [Enterococcus faecalis]